MVRTRFAPSPTGLLHIGGLRTALYAYALAKKSGGDFILRIEDTDQKREVKGAVKALQETLTKFGIDWNEFYIQSERLKTGIYEKAAQILIKNGHAFYCQCKARNADEEGYSSNLRDVCRNKKLTSGAIKLKVPEGQELSYFDFVHKKKIYWNTDTVYDATLLKSDGFPTYHLGAIVDDLDMKITHILRGHDWLPSTPIHLLIFDFLGGKRPEIGHLTDILSAVTGKKLSKRRDSVFCEQYLKDGILPEALLNFVMLLGWAPKDNREFFNLRQFVDNFNIEGFQQANPRFLIDKMLWFNGFYIRQKTSEELYDLFKPFLPEKAEQSLVYEIIPLIKERIKKLSDFTSLAGFFFEKPKVDKNLFAKDYKIHLKKAIEAFMAMRGWSNEAINKELLEVIKDNGFKTGDFFMTLRIAITGSKFTPPINESMVILGKDETLDRLKNL